MHHFAVEVNKTTCSACHHYHHSQKSSTRSLTAQMCPRNLDYSIWSSLLLRWKARVNSSPSIMAHRSSGVRWFLFDGYMMDAAPFTHTNWFARLPREWLHQLACALIRVNPFCRWLILQDSGNNEIAAVMSFDNTIRNEIRRISAISRMWEPLVYPLLFPHGTHGWGITNAVDDWLIAARDGPGAADDEQESSQMWWYRSRLLREERFQIFGRLANEYICDMFTRNIETRLNYIRANQSRIREEDAVLMGYNEAEFSEHYNIYLPSSVAATYGPPTFFVTFTCNPAWPEIQSRLRPGQHWSDIPMVVCRVFNQKLHRLLKDQQSFARRPLTASTGLSNLFC